MPETTPQSEDTQASESRDWKSEAHRIFIVTKIGVVGLYKSQLPRMAAALAFRTIFSIIPVMAIGLLIFGSIVSEDQVESGVRRVLDFAGISQISTINPKFERLVEICQNRGSFERDEIGDEVSFGGFGSSIMIQPS